MVTELQPQLMVTSNFNIFKMGVNSRDNARTDLGTLEFEFNQKRSNTKEAEWFMSWSIQSRYQPCQTKRILQTLQIVHWVWKRR